MSEIVDTDGSTKPTPPGTADPGEHEPDPAAASVENGEDNGNGEENEKLAELKKRTHPFD
jgi:hypothetical protein